MTRRHLPSTRIGITHKFVIHAPQLGRVKGYFTYNTFPDASPGELFIHIDSMDESTRGNLRCLCLFISLSFQHGTPMHAVIQKLRGQRFEPSGFTESQDIPNCSSIVDYIARWLERHFADNPALAHAPASDPLSQTNKKGDTAQ